MQEIYGRVRRAATDYSMIREGDKIAVGVSGGKDSLLTLAALKGLQRFYDKAFTLEAITLDLGFPGVDLGPVADFCNKLGVAHTVVTTQIAPVVFDIRKEPNPCSLCAKMRRGALHETALSLGCRKVALGHHADDAVETFWMSLLFEGRAHCFSPVTWLDRRDITLIRPLLYVWESEVRLFRETLPVVHNPCPANGKTQRQNAKETLLAMEAAYPDLRKRIFRAVQGRWGELGIG